MEGNHRENSIYGKELGRSDAETVTHCYYF